MVNEIKAFLNTQLSLKSRGCLLYSGGFSRNEISIVNGKLISDMELLFLYKKKSEAKKLIKKIKKINLTISNVFSIIPPEFEIELECVSVTEIINRKCMLPVHQYESIKTNNIIFNNIDFSSYFERVSVLKESVYDIFIHRILNQTSLAFNYMTSELNGVFFNRSMKNASDYLTYIYLSKLDENPVWICKKADRVKFLVRKRFLNDEAYNYFRFGDKIQMTEFEQFIFWKSIMTCWGKKYLATNANIDSCSKQTSLIGKLYRTSIKYILKGLGKKTPNLSVIIRLFVESLNKSESFVEFNTILRCALKPYGFSSKTYPYINGIFFTYWLRHAKYYKSIK